MNNNQKKNHPLFVCLMYHQIQTPYINKYYISLETFKQQVQLVLRHNRIAKLEDPGEKGILFTFDDGHKSNLEAARYLSEHGIQGVFYVIKDFSLSDPEYLSARDIKEISDMGHIIGVHGKDHGWWTKKNPDNLISEIQETKKWIESITNVPCITCSAPGGRILSREYEYIRTKLPELMYIRSTRQWFNHSSDINLNCVAVLNTQTLDTFRKIIAFDKLHYFRIWVIWAIKEIIKRIVYREII